MIGSEWAWPGAKKSLLAEQGWDLALGMGPALENGAGWGIHGKAPQDHPATDAGRSHYKTSLAILELGCGKIHH